jgi:hypothetical protein
MLPISYPFTFVGIADRRPEVVLKSGKWDANYGCIGKGSLYSMQDVMAVRQNRLLIAGLLGLRAAKR